MLVEGPISSRRLGELPLPACIRNRVYPISAILIGRSRINPTSAERVGVRGRFHDSERSDSRKRPLTRHPSLTLGCRPLPASAGLSGEKIRESYQTLGVLEFVAIHQHARLETTKLSHMNHLSPFPGQPCRKRGEVKGS